MPQPKGAYTPKDSVYPLQGLNARDPSTLTDPRYAVRCDNMTVKKGVASKRSGWRRLGTQTALDGNPIVALIDFATGNGNHVTVACTTTRQYKYDADGDAWVNITGPTAGAPVEWTGTEVDGVQYCVATDNFGTWLYITNGIDMPRRWDGSTATFEDVGSAAGFNLPEFNTCKTIAAFAGSLFFGGVKTSGQTQPKTVAWSDTNNFNEWLDGNSGTDLYADLEGDIWRFLPLGEQLIVYSSNSIGATTFVGGDQLFSFEALVNRTQLLSPRSMVNLGPAHLFASEENIYLFDGTRLHKSIGDVVQNAYRDDIGLDIAGRAWAFHDSIESQVYFAVPYDAENTYVYVADFDLKNMQGIRYVRHHYAGRLSSMGYVVRDGILTWEQLGDTTWADWAGAWKKRTTRGAFPVRCTGTADGDIFIYDDGNHDDAGTAVDAVWESIDFTLPADYISSTARFVQVEIELRGKEVDVAINTQKGDPSGWVAVKTAMPLATDWKRYVLCIDKTAESIRVRLRNAYSGSGFEMRWLRVWYRAGGPR